MLAASVNNRPMVAMSFLTIFIHYRGGRPRGLFTSVTSRASIRACAAGEFGRVSSDVVAKLLQSSSLHHSADRLLACSGIQVFIRDDVGIIRRWQVVV